MIEGQPADSFFLIRDGFVALQTESPAGVITIETLHNGDPVGWSWLFEPYLNHFDARSRGVTHGVRFDGAALRARCTQEPELGYELMRSFASVIVERLRRDAASATGRLWPRHCQLVRSRPGAR